MSLVSCPLCDDYTGVPTSVEAHISAKGDERHKGKIGKEYREKIREKLPGGSDGQPVAVDEDTDDVEHSLPTSEAKPAGEGEGGNKAGTDETEPSDGIVQVKKEDDDPSEGLTIVAVGGLATLLWFFLQNQSPEKVEDIVADENDTGPEVV